MVMTGAGTREEKLDKKIEIHYYCGQANYSNNYSNNRFLVNSSMQEVKKVRLSNKFSVQGSPDLGLTACCVPHPEISLMITSDNIRHFKINRLMSIEQQ